MKEVTIENGGTPITDLNDPQCTHTVINDQEIKQLPNLVKESDQDANSPAILNGSQTTSTNGSVTPTSKQTDTLVVNKFLK